MKLKSVEYPALVSGYVAEVATESSVYALELTEGIRGMRVKATAYIEKGKWKVRIGNNIIDVITSIRM